MNKKKNMAYLAAFPVHPQLIRVNYDDCRCGVASIGAARVAIFRKRRAATSNTAPGPGNPVGKLIRSDNPEEFDAGAGTLSLPRRS